MKKMKKWELLKKAYETFPAGTRFTWGGYTITSSGIFNFSDDERNKGHILDSNDKVVFDGKQWAEIIEEIKPEPKKGFVMMSEDGIDLNFGDEYYRAEIYKGSWILSTFKGDVYLGKLEPTDYVLNSPSEAKAFRTKEAAEKWILETNKPKEINIDLFGSNKASIFSEKIIISCGNAYSVIKPSDLEDMLHAYKSLQS